MHTSPHPVPLQRLRAYFATFLFLFALSLSQSLYAFCGFYVAKGGASLFNESSQVILVRDAGKTVITMSNDFKGDAKDFAMVVPVPVVLKRDQIRIAERAVFQRLDDYSAPRLVEYHDSDPCRRYDYDSMDNTAVPTEALEEEDKDAKSLGVTVEAKYTVGEYDILLLSAKESSGLETWLKANGYSIPDQAEEVLQPYIKSQMKFFVVKVNLEEQQKLSFSYLRPLQIEFESTKFGLPIRLGMANANKEAESATTTKGSNFGWQDLIIYAFTKSGRVETTNYRTVPLPTDRDIPTVIQPRFGDFYKDLFKKKWEAEGQNAVLLEYAWDISSTNFVKCDPCPTQPPSGEDLRNAGVFWLSNSGERTTADYNGQVFITRLHVRYNREKYPQDLQFHITPNKENFQGRYVMRHGWPGPYDCKEGKEYALTVVNRRKREVDELGALTGWETTDFKGYVDEYKQWLPASLMYQFNPEEGEGKGLFGGGSGDANAAGDAESEGPKLPMLLIYLGVFLGMAVVVLRLVGRKKT